MAILQAIVSVVADQGDMIRSMQAGAHQLVFLLRGHLYLVAVSSAGEPKVALVRQLEMLYHQMLVIVTTSESAIGKDKRCWVQCTRKLCCGLRVVKDSCCAMFSL